MAISDKQQKYQRLKKNNNKMARMKRAQFTVNIMHLKKQKKYQSFNKVVFKCFDRPNKNKHVHGTADLPLATPTKPNKLRS